MRNVVKTLYEERLKYKIEGSKEYNPVYADTTVKICLNSIYGKTLQKEQLKDCQFVTK